MDFTWDSVDEYSSNMSVIDYESKNLLKLLDESRYVIEEFLLRHSEISYAADANVHINNIVVHMNGVEILAFPFDKSVDDMYHTELSLSSKLLDAQSLTGVENFAEILVSGNLFRSRECYAFKQHLKGKVLEHELGM
jgi:hypothetical protein